MLLNSILILLSVLGTVAVYLLTPSLSLWWALPILIGCFVGSVVAYLVFLCLAAPFLPAKKPIKRPNRFCRFMIWFTMDWLMKLFGIRVTLKGREKLPARPCVIVSNHRSDFDPMALLAVLRERNLVYISKDANFRLPLVGNYINNAGFIPIDRNNGVRALRSLKLAAERMTDTGVDVGVYPEGTRSKSGTLLRFKSGAFHLAQMANAPIVIMTTKGTERVSRNLPFRRTHVEMEILEVIDAEAVAAGTVEALCAHAREVIEKGLEET